MMFELPERIEDWPEEWRDAWIERAAIMEYDAGMSKDDAEREAEKIIRAEYMNLGPCKEQCQCARCKREQTERGEK